ncbi:transglycosylase [Hyphomicrobium methylovorum]|nr:MltA domain-containing protein [Hyphomicrobium methylovorum]MBA2126124.1 transglycosylase [Hyphomicrobium methylovorum]
MPSNAVSYAPIPYSAIPGWREDDHLLAWKAFLSSCDAVLSAPPRAPASQAAPPVSALLNVCRRALSAGAAKKVRTRHDARHFFETHFAPNRVVSPTGTGLLTGYYEPLIKGARKQDAEFATPIYRRPSDLVNIVAESERGATTAAFTHMRDLGSGTKKPYLTRAEIEQGGLEGKGLELVYFKDPVDVFFLQVQGSGRVQLPDGTEIRVAYDGKNGYPYTSIGRVLIDRGELTAETMSLQALKQWLRADAIRGRELMWHNKSYVFFRELTGSDAKGPIGANNIPLQTGRSLAVDTAFHVLGTPIFVEAPKLTHATKSGGFHRLMIAHDVGSAIKGPQRGDIYFGSGDKAGRLAGITKEPGTFIVLIPRDQPLSGRKADRRP